VLSWQLAAAEPELGDEPAEDGAVEPDASDDASMEPGEAITPDEEEADPTAEGEVDHQAAA
jgi:hypothetical protein